MAVADLYTNGQYLKNNPGWHIDAAHWKARSILQILQRNQISPQTVCEIGCGAGEILRLLQQELGPASTLTGYDIAPQAIELARTRENEHLHFHLADFLQEKTEHFDLILMISVIEHFENCFQVLRDIKASSTYKVFLFSLDVSMISVLHNEPLKFHRTTGHLHFFTKDIALEIVKDQGYEVLDYFYVRPPLESTPWSAVRTHPRKLLAKLLRMAKRGLERLPGRMLYALNKDLAVRIFGGWRLMVLVK